MRFGSRRLSSSILLLALGFVLVFVGVIPVHTAAQIHGGQAVLEVHFLDVGQGDSVLIKLPEDQVILIDGGPSIAGGKVVRYLKENGVDRIDHLVATHPHEDHIGGLVAVLRAFPVGKVYMPDALHSSEVYLDLLLEIASSSLKIARVRAGLTLDLGPEVEAMFLAPNAAEYAGLNDYSAVLRISYGNTAFLFMGDAEMCSEEEILDNDWEVSADVLKLGHHGSKTSTAQSFLKAVSPSIAVITVGLGNKYGHPHPDVIRLLKRQKIAIYHTDFDGAIMISSDGHNLGVFTNQGPLPEIEYVGNRKSKVFHLPDCSNLPEEKNRMYFESWDEAVEAGYSPCGQCKPENQLSKI